MADQKAFKKRLKVLMNRTENLQCVDCSEKQPRWASLIKPPPGMEFGMGAFMCLECSGSHRRLGVHISFVRSVNLDSWKEHEVAIMENGGNDKINAAYEAHLNRSGSQKVTNLSNGQQRERYIRDKYERRKFYDPSALDDYEPAVEQVAAKPNRDRTSRGAPPTAAISRAPSDAARRRAEARNARAGNDAAAPERPARVVAPAAPAPAVDLLDFASFESAPAAPPPQPAPATNPATLDLFANMTVSNPGPAAPTAHAPANKTNDDILSLFSTPSQPTNNINNNNMQMMGGMNQGMPQQGMQQNNHMQQMMPNNTDGMRNQQMMQQQQQQQQMMLQQQQMMQQRMMMQQQQHNGQMMMPQQGGMPQQQMYKNNGQMPQQQMNQMQMMQIQQQMMQHPNKNIQGGAGTMMPNGGGMPQGMMQQQPSDGGFGAPMGSGPSISNIQGTAAPPKQDPFADFGFNAFR